jgi:hypothetical protein
MASVNFIQMIEMLALADIRVGLHGAICGVVISHASALLFRYSPGSNAPSRPSEIRVMPPRSLMLVRPYYGGTLVM